MKKVTVIFLSASVLIASSCEKDHLFDCLKSTGSIVSEEREVSDFNRIDVYNNPEVILTQDVVNSITVEAGGHIISGITTEISNGTLTIRNENKCNWVRSYSKTIAVYVHVKKLDIIHHHGSSSISSANTLENTKFDFNIWNSGDIEVAVNTDSMFSKLGVAVGSMTVKGHAGYSYVYNIGSGFAYEHDLQADHSFIDYHGTGDCYVSVSHDLAVKLYDAGNVYYSGNPQVSSSIYGSGQLIHQ